MKPNSLLGGRIDGFPLKRDPSSPLPAQCSHTSAPSACSPAMWNHPTSKPSSCLLSERNKKCRKPNATTTSKSSITYFPTLIPLFSQHQATPPQNQHQPSLTLTPTNPTHPVPLHLTSQRLPSPVPSSARQLQRHLQRKGAQSSSSSGSGSRRGTWAGGEGGFLWGKSGLGAKKTSLSKKRTDFVY